MSSNLSSSNATVSTPTTIDKMIRINDAILKHLEKCQNCHVKIVLQRALLEDKKIIVGRVEPKPEPRHKQSQHSQPTDDNKMDSLFVKSSEAL